MEPQPTYLVVLILSSSTNLVPEKALTEHLSPLWQKRFEQATELLAKSLEQPFNWAPIAAQCAVSPNHFHVMFKAVYGETPAAYQRRLRMKLVLHLLCFATDKSITDIALEAGFSSSQNLAKVLQRVFGLSATQIRSDSSHDRYLELRSQLEHHIEGISQEQRLSENIEFQLVERPPQWLHLHNCNTQDPIQAGKQWLKITPKQINLGVALTPWEVLYDLTAAYKIGYYCSEPQANLQIPQTHYLTCSIKIRDNSGYLVAWEALFRELLRRGYEVDDTQQLLEHFHNARDWLSFSATVTLMVPIKSQQS